ncbi:MAG: AAA family ATPase [Balneolaceae bacterium]
MKRTNKLKLAVSHDARRKLYDKQDKEISKADVFIERELLTAVIVNDEVAKWVEEHLQYEWVQSVTAKKILKKVLSFYGEYGEAPKNKMEALYFEWLQNGQLNEEEAEELEEDLLPGLSAEYEENGIDTKFLIQRAGKYFEKRRLEVHSKRISDALNTGDMEQAEHLAGNPPESLGSGKNLIVRDIDDYANLERPKLLLSPWLREGEYTLVYADKGVGKTMFAVLLSRMLACADYQARKCEINASDSTVWQVKHPTKTLYVAGEMAQGIMDRFAGFHWMGEYIEQYKPRIIDRGEQQATTNQPFSLSNRNTQREVIRYLKQNPNIKLIVLDNVQTLFDLEDSNRESEWSNKINPLLQDLEDCGIACLLLDHTGKDPNRGAMGTHAKTTRTSYSIHLKDHSDKNRRNDGQAWFKVESIYTRYPEGKFHPFYLRFWKEEHGTQWEVTEGGAFSGNDNKNQEIKAAIIQGDKGTDIAERFDITPARVSQIKNRIEKEGLLKNGEPTMEGFSFMKELEENI